MNKKNPCIIIIKLRAAFHLLLADPLVKSNQSNNSSDGGMIERLPGGGGQCLVCGRAFSGLRNAKRHYNTVHLQENSPCRCPVCKKTFLRKELMKDHLRRKHKMYKDMYKSLLGYPTKTTSSQVQPKIENPEILRPETVLHEGGSHHQLLGEGCSSLSSGTGSTSGLSLQIQHHHQQRPPMPVLPLLKWPPSENSAAEVEGGPLSVLRPEVILSDNISDAAASNNSNSVQVKNEPLEPAPNSDDDQ